MDINQGLSNVWNIMDNDCVEEISIRLRHAKEDTEKALKEEGTCTELYLAYFEESRNLYTICSDQVIYEFENETLVYANSNRPPGVVLNRISEGDSCYQGCYDRIFGRQN